MRTIRPALCFFALLLSLETSRAESASGITLDQVISQATHSSLDIKNAQSVSEEATWKKVESYSGFLPSLSAGGTYLLKKKYVLTDLVFGGSPVSVPQITPNSSLILSAQLPLFDGLNSTNRYFAARALEQSAQHELNWTQFKTDREVTLQFYKALGAQVLREVAVQNLKTIDEHLKDSRLFKSSGLSTNYDVLRVEVQSSEAQSELLNAEDNVVTERNRLAEIMGVNTELPELSGTLPVFQKDQIASFNADTSSGRSDIKALEAKQVAYDRIEASRSTYWVPKISLAGQYQYYNNLNDTFSDWGRYRNAYQVGILATWNLFDGMESFARSKQSVQERVQADISLEKEQIHTKQDLDFWRRKFGYFTAVYRSRVDDVAKAQESVRLAREGRKVGARSNSELLDAEVDLFRSRAQLVNAQIGAIESLIHLELASGQSLYPFHQ